MSGRRPWKFGAGTVIFIVLALLVLAVLATRRSRTLTVNQTLQLDDFCFTVLEARRLPADPATVEATRTAAVPCRLPGPVEDR